MQSSKIIPNEILCLILELAYKDSERVIEVTPEERKSGFITWGIQATHPPRFLHLNRAIRSYFLNRYIAPFAEDVDLDRSCQRLATRHILLDPKKDILFLKLKLYGSLSTTLSIDIALNDLFGAQANQVAALIRKVAVSGEKWSPSYPTVYPFPSLMVSCFKRHFPNLEVAIFDPLDRVRRLEAATPARLWRFLPQPTLCRWAISHSEARVVFYRVAEVQYETPSWDGAYRCGFLIGNTRSGRVIVRDTDTRNDLHTQQF